MMMMMMMMGMTMIMMMMNATTYGVTERLDILFAGSVE